MSTTDSPRVEGSIPVRGNFLAEFILLSYNTGRSDRMIYLWKTSKAACNWGRMLCVAKMLSKANFPPFRKTSVKICITNFVPT